MKQKLFTRAHGYPLDAGRDGPDLTGLLGEAVFVVPEMAWLGLHELHRRGLGEYGSFQLPGIDQLTPLQAIDGYDRASGAVLAQLFVDGPERGGQVVESIEDFARGSGSLAGLEGILASAGLTADRDHTGGYLVDTAASLMKEFGVAPNLGAGRGATPLMDAATNRIAGVAADTLQQFANQGGGDRGAFLRGELDRVIGPGGQPAPSSGGSGGFDLGGILLGGLKFALGVVAFAENPIVGGALMAKGGATVIDGLGQGRHGSTPADATHPSGARLVETHHERVTIRKEQPDGTVISAVREVFDTKHILTDTRVKGSANGGDTKLWDDIGGGTDPDTGEPQPVNPIAVLACPPGEDGQSGSKNYIDGPRRNQENVIDKFGPYDALEAVMNAGDTTDGPVDLNAVFADWTVSRDGLLLAPEELVIEPADPATKYDELLPWIGTDRPPAENTTDQGRVYRVTRRDGSAVYVNVTDGADPAAGVGRVVEETTRALTPRLGLVRSWETDYATGFRYPVYT